LKLVLLDVVLKIRSLVTTIEREREPLDTRTDPEPHSIVSESQKKKEVVLKILNLVS
jgi:hypothetical protein